MKRDPSIDALRGLAIILVVAGHAIPISAAVLQDGPGLVKVDAVYWVPLATASNLFFSLIYSFHMPLFAFVSGLVLWPPKDTGLGSQTFKKARGLVIPYLAWGVVLWALMRWTTALPSSSFTSALVSSLIGRGGLWYLYAVFVCSVVVIVLARSRQYRWLLPASALGAIVLATGQLFRIPDVLQLGNVLWIYPFVVLGFFARPRGVWVRAHRWWVVAGGVAAYLPLFYLRYPVHVPTLQPINAIAIAVHNAGLPGGFMFSILLPYLCALAGVMALYAVYVGRSGRTISLQGWVGRRSLGIYAMHGPLLWWLVAAGVRNAVILTVLALGISLGLTVVLERIPIIRSLFLGQGAPRSAPMPPTDAS